MRHDGLLVERLAKSGDGVAQLGGRAVFIEGALPGETVAAEVTEIGKVLRGELLEVSVASPHRRTPLCPLAVRCGGCPLMHLSEGAQLESKAHIVASTLAHVGGIAVDAGQLDVLEPFKSPLPMGYRRRATLHPVEGRLGFFGRRSHDRVVVDLCPALTPPLQHLPSLLADALSAGLKEVLEVRVIEAESCISVSVHLKGAVKEKVRDALTTLVREGLLTGAVMVPGEGKGASVELGKPVLEDAGLFQSPDGFAQANAMVNEAMVERSLEWLALSGTEAVLELYSGNGNFTFGLAAHASSVTAVESSRVSVQLAQQAARKRGVSNIRFVQNDAEKSADGFVREGARFDRLLLDPPRAGAPGVGAWAARLLVNRVVYIACDPASLARDAAALLHHGFRAEKLQVFDLFPQTHHIEAVMSFVR